MIGMTSFSSRERSMEDEGLGGRGVRGREGIVDVGAEALSGDP
jgi:hypothetical protein